MKKNKAKKRPRYIYPTFNYRQKRLAERVAWKMLKALGLEGAVDTVALYAIPDEYADSDAATKYYPEERVWCLVIKDNLSDDSLKEMVIHESGHAAQQLLNEMKEGRLSVEGIGRWALEEKINTLFTESALRNFGKIEEICDIDESYYRQDGL